MSTRLYDLIKRRGLVWQSFEIYGGVSGFLDFGPIGYKILRKIEEKWRKFFIDRHDFIYEISTPIVMPSIVFEASGHLEHFTDSIVVCKNCGRKFRVDNIIEIEEVDRWNESQIEEYIVKNNIKCPNCGGDFDKPSKFNLLMKTNISPYAEEIGYLRPEAAQGVFINFKKVYELTGKKLPLGIVQIGKVDRNEISPRKGLFRMREFTIIDLEIFYDYKNPRCSYIAEILNKEIRVLDVNSRSQGKKEPYKASIGDLLEKGIVKNEWLVYFMFLAQEFLNELGIQHDNQYFLEKFPEERAHYSSQTFDQMVKISDGSWIEVSGHALRTDYDLRNHSLKSGVSLTAERIENNKVVERFYPHVAEPSFGIERIFLTVLDNCLYEQKSRLILKLPYDIAPYIAVVAPLVNKEKIVSYAYRLYKELKSNDLDVIFDDTEYIGKIYAKYDEIGVPFCITVDYQSIEDNTVTIRNRDDWKQIRIASSQVGEILKKLIRKEVKFEEAGVLFSSS
jgi:glycyl-tRNA synthetase, dimeric type